MTELEDEVSALKTAHSALRSDFDKLSENYHEGEKRIVFLKKPQEKLPVLHQNTIPNVKAEIKA